MFTLASASAFGSYVFLSVSCRGVSKIQVVGLELKAEIVVKDGGCFKGVQNPCAFVQAARAVHKFASNVLVLHAF